MSEQDEIRTWPANPPFSLAVEKLKRAIDDTEHFDLAVKAALACVKEYTEHTLSAAPKLPAAHAEMVYEHGFTLFRRELSDDLTLPFARLRP